MLTRNTSRIGLGCLLAIVLLAQLFLLPFPTHGRPRLGIEHLGPARQSGLFVIDDFNGDRLPDAASLISHGFHKQIELALNGGRAFELSFNADTSMPGMLVARDIDQDGDLDLVWVLETRPQSSVIWLGDGQGDFELAKDPESYSLDLSGLLQSTNAPGLSGGGAGSEPACVSNFLQIGPGLSQKRAVLPPLGSSTKRFTGTNNFHSGEHPKHARIRPPPLQSS